MFPISYHHAHNHIFQNKLLCKLAGHLGDVITLTPAPNKKNADKIS